MDGLENLMDEPTPRELQRERTINALIDEQYESAISRGSVIRNPPAWRAAKRTDIVAQAREHPGWLRQQSDRIFGEQKRPSKLATCPHCELAFDANQPQEPITLEFSAPLHPRWIHPSSDRLVAVPPEFVADYQRLGWKPIPDVLQPLPTLTVHDYPTRGRDGLLYCRPSCARLEPFIRRPLPDRELFDINIAALIAGEPELIIDIDPLDVLIEDL
jgi:hypothetical protein